MKHSMSALMLSTLVAALAWTAAAVPARAQSANQQTPAQADQTREQDRKNAGDVTVGRDWKAQKGNPDQVGRTDTDKDNHETVGRDWRAHPDHQDR